MTSINEDMNSINEEMGIEALKKFQAQFPTPPKKKNTIGTSIATGIIIFLSMVLIGVVLFGPDKRQTAQAEVDPVSGLKAETAALETRNKELEKEIQVNKLLIESNNTKIKALTYEQ